MTDSPGRPFAEPPVSTLTSAQVSAVATRGIWTSPTSIDPLASGVGEALVATLRGTVAPNVLTPELQQLSAAVLRRADIGFPWITAPDRVRLSAHSVKQKTADPRPVVIVPSGWTPFGWVLFEYAYLQLAMRGYHVLAYTPRGIGATARVPGGAYADGPYTSEGAIDVAGPKDWADGSAVIDFAERHFRPSAIAFFGESYGSGISQLVAANDPAARVKAVVALSTWGNLAKALIGHDTVHRAAVEALVNSTGGPLERKFDEPTRRLLTGFERERNLAEVIAWGSVRAPESFVGETNARGIPTFMSSTWHETLFPVSEVVETFQRLTVPRRLNLWIGDHVAPEATGLVVPSPGPNPPVTEAFAWLDHHLLGVKNGVPAWPTVSSQVMFTYQTRPNPAAGREIVVVPAQREAAVSWEAATTDSERWYLTGGGPDGLDGSLSKNPDYGWAREFTVGQAADVAAAGATAVDAVMTTGQAEWNGNPKIYETDKFERQYLLVWTSAPLSARERGRGTTARRVRGTPRVHFSVASSAESATLVAYLFDVDAEDNARIITHEPYTFEDLPPNEGQTVEWTLQPAAYDVPVGHRLMLVVDSADPLYSSASVEFSKTTISSPRIDAARLDLPLG